MAHYSQIALLQKGFGFNCPSRWGIYLDHVEKLLVLSCLHVSKSSFFHYSELLISQGFSRYWTPEIKDLLGELSQAESEKESKLKSILQRLIERFCDNHVKWRQFISTVAGNSIVLNGE